MMNMMAMMRTMEMMGPDIAAIDRIEGRIGAPLQFLRPPFRVGAEEREGKDLQQ
jgi:hypothetical protein